MNPTAPAGHRSGGAVALLLARLPTNVVPALIAAAVAAHAITPPAAASDFITPPASRPPVDGGGPAHQSRLPAAASIATAGAPSPAFAWAAFSAQDLATLEEAGPGTLSAVAAYLDRTDRQLVSAEAGAITEPDRAELLLVGSGRGCAACRPRWIAVWDLILQAPRWTTPDGDGSGTIAAITGNGIGFARTDAVWGPNDAGCCPGGTTTHLLEWDGTTFTQRRAGDPEPPRPLPDHESATDADPPT